MPKGWVDQDGFDGPALRSLLELMVEFCSSTDLGDWDRSGIEAPASNDPGGDWSRRVSRKPSTPRSRTSEEETSSVVSLA